MEMLIRYLLFNTNINSGGWRMGKSEPQMPQSCIKPQGASRETSKSLYSPTPSIILDPPE